MLSSTGQVYRAANCLPDDHSREIPVNALRSLADVSQSQSSTSAPIRYGLLHPGHPDTLPGIPGTSAASLSSQILC